MGELVRGDSDEVDVGAVVVVQPEVVEHAGEATRVAQVDVEPGPDIGVRVDVGAELLVGQRHRVQGARDAGAGEVAPHGDRAGAAQDGRSLVAAQRFPGGEDRDRR